MEKTILKTTQIIKVYTDATSENTVIKKAELSIEKGEFVMIIGPSGSGKSTLLYLLSGLREPSSGQILFENKAYSSLKTNELASLRRRFFGFIMQQHFLVPYLNCVENVCLGRTYGFQAEAKKILSELGLTKHYHKYPNALSYGERQRVAVARGLIHQPTILFADEPTASVNAELADFIVDYLKAYCQAGGSCLMVTHDLTLLTKASRVLSLKDGILENFAYTASEAKIET